MLFCYSSGKVFWVCASYIWAEAGCTGCAASPWCLPATTGRDWGRRLGYNCSIALLFIYLCLSISLCISIYSVSLSISIYLTIYHSISQYTVYTILKSQKILTDTKCSLSLSTASYLCRVIEGSQTTTPQASSFYETLQLGRDHWHYVVLQKDGICFS